MSHLLAIDAGGTSTRTMVLDDTARCLGIGRGGRGNPVSEGTVAAAASIASATETALRAANVTGEQIRSVSLALAGGLSTDAGSDWLTLGLRPLGLTGQITVEHDLLALYFSGSYRLCGYGLVAGTGSTAVRVNDGEVDRVIDGLGWLIGDQGSGFWIGQQVARAVARALDTRPPGTSMVQPVLAELGIAPDLRRDHGRARALSGLTRYVYTSSPLSLARLAPIAFADPGDPVSIDIVSRAAAGLASMILDLYDDALAGPLVIGGGVVSAQPRLFDRIVATVREGGVTAPVQPVQDGLVGAGVIALRRAGIAVDADMFTRLQTSAAACATPRPS